MKRVDAPIDRATGLSKHDPQTLSMGSCRVEFNNTPTPGRCVGPLGWKIMKAAGFVWNPESAGYEQYYSIGLNPIDSAGSYLFSGDRVLAHVHPTVGRGDIRDDGDYLYVCSIGHVEWPAYLSADELSVFVALIDEDFRALMARLGGYTKAIEHRLDAIPEVVRTTMEKGEVKP